MKEIKKYKVVNLMSWNEEEQDDDVECLSLTDEYTKLACIENSELYPDQNKNIGKPRFFFLSLDRIIRQIYEKENVDLFCEENTECYGETFNIWNPNITEDFTDIIIKYKPLKI